MVRTAPILEQAVPGTRPIESAEARPRPSTQPLPKKQAVDIAIDFNDAYQEQAAGCKVSYPES